MRPLFRTPLAEEFNDVPLPPDLTPAQIVAAIRQLQVQWHALDRASRRVVGRSFEKFLCGEERATCSSVVSRSVVSYLVRGRYRRGRPQHFPDAIHRTRGTLLEVKANSRNGRPQGHNAEAGWYLVLRYELNARRIPEVFEIRIGHLRVEQLRITPDRGRRTRTASLRLRDLALWYRRPRARRSCSRGLRSAPVRGFRAA